LISGLETVVEDDFDLIGAAPGTPVSFTVVLHLSGEGHNFGPPGGTGGASIRASLLEGAGNGASVEHGTLGEQPLFVSESISRPVAATAGTPVPLRLMVGAASVEGRGQMDGLLEFTGLPPGVQLVSCRGYFSAAPVASRQMSWGRLKASYR